jgi:hypothetical protein
MNPETSGHIGAASRRGGGMLPMIALGSLAWLMTRKPISQNQSYHQFVDRRSFLGVPNFCNVASNLPFVAAGVQGARFCLRDESVVVRAPWAAFFAGVAMTGFGSAYYHLRPEDETLLWDRLPMSVAFMGLFSALVGEQSGPRAGSRLLGPALLAGCGSVVYWFRKDDLRPYYLVQGIPLLAIPATSGAIRRQYTDGRILFGALGWYALAKVVEFSDEAIYRKTRRAVSGHTLKHFLAAAGCYAVLRWLKRRVSRNQR